MALATLAKRSRRRLALIALGACGTLALQFFAIGAAAPQHSSLLVLAAVTVAASVLFAYEWRHYSTGADSLRNHSAAPGPDPRPAGPHATIDATAGHTRTALRCNCLVCDWAVTHDLDYGIAIDHISKTTSSTSTSTPTTPCSSPSAHTPDAEPA